MKNAKRCLAILLAVTLLCSNGVSQLGTIVSASELETTEEAQPKEDAVVEQAEETKEDTGKATVEGVTPEEERGESSAQDARDSQCPKGGSTGGTERSKCTGSGSGNGSSNNGSSNNGNSGNCNSGNGSSSIRRCRTTRRSYSTRGADI